METPRLLLDLADFGSPAPQAGVAPGPQQVGSQHVGAPAWVPVEPSSFPRSLFLFLRFFLLFFFLLRASRGRHTLAWARGSDIGGSPGYSLNSG